MSIDLLECSKPRRFIEQGIEDGGLKTEKPKSGTIYKIQKRPNLMCVARESNNQLQELWISVANKTSAFAPLWSRLNREFCFKVALPALSLTSSFLGPTHTSAELAKTGGSKITP
jgi:hypothetical protein